MTHPLRRPLMPLVLPALLLAACATATGEDTMAGHRLQGEGPFQRFIVRYRDGSVPARDRDSVPGRLARAAAQVRSSPAPVPRWQRRLAVGADVFTVDPPLDRRAAEALMQALARDPDVEYVEVDRMMGIGPQPTMPMRDGD
ncbi:hypothetical protein QF205_11465 [Luteimonas composti]|uniref:Lipoprotein n=1 Tax=Luteimonas composti TaxID=398257 RepID=A0ABT6MSR1_9GAMM|nr:hypothetical protein [Luteimonas composti]MDH7453682.1 hypothetical protein [Luteimonas composti]